MSNTKWRKFFNIANSRSLEINACVWKLTDTEEPVQGFLPEVDELGKDYVGDCGALNGPFPFSLIEWLFIPSTHSYREYEKAPLKYIKQDVYKIAEQLEALGQFELEFLGDGIKVYGYKVYGYKV
ncbi:hypothetical protein ACFL17_08505 [Pseudomonadota bacterium]